MKSVYALAVVAVFSGSAACAQEDPEELPPPPASISQSAFSGTTLAAGAGLGEVLVTTNRQQLPYSLEGRPIIGLRRPADSVVTSISFSSDSRDAAVRRSEIQTMILAALTRAGAAGVELVNGNFDLQPVTKSNYTGIYLNNGLRSDTSVVALLVKIKFTGSIYSTIDRMQSYVKSLPRSGRGAIDSTSGGTLTIVNPDQYRDAIIKLVADDARKQAAVFGPDYAVQLSGIDNQVAWSQVSQNDIFLYIPYKFTIVPKK